MKRDEYQVIFKMCGLTDEQVQSMCGVIEAHLPSGRQGFIDGWTDGMNCVYHFLDGSMEEHDEFEHESFPVTVEHNALVEQATTLLAINFAMLAEIIKPCAVDVATQIKGVLNEGQLQAFSTAMESLAAPRLSALVIFLDGRKLNGEWTEGHFGARGVWWVEFIKSLNEK